MLLFIFPSSLFSMHVSIPKQNQDLYKSLYSAFLMHCIIFSPCHQLFLKSLKYINYIINACYLQKNREIKINKKIKI